MQPIKKTLGTAVLALLASTSCISLVQAQATDVKAGQDLYMKRGCYLCHGGAGQGSAAGPTLAPDTMPFEALSVFVRTPANQMPPYSEKMLSNAELRNIHAYLASIPKPKSADGIPLLPKIETK